MLEFRLNNIPIVVGRDTSVKLRWVNPACKFDEIPGDVGLGVEIGVNEYTRRTFGNPERFEKYNAGDDREYPGFEIRFSGMLLHSGTYIITDADQNSYKGWVRGNVGTLGKEEREKFINEAGCFDKVVAFVNKAVYAPGTDNYCCPVIFNPEFFKGIGKEVKDTRTVPDPKNPGKYIQEEYQTEVLTYWFLKTTSGFVNVRHPNGYVKSPTSIVQINKINKNDATEVTAVTPMFYLNYVIKELLKSHRFYISHNYLETDIGFSGLCIYNNYDITQNEPLTIETIVVFPWENAVGGVRYYGLKMEGLQRLTASFALTKVKNHLPKISLKDFIISIQNTTNSCFFFKRDNTVKIISRETIITGGSYNLDKYFLNEWILGEKKNVTLKFMMDHDKDDLIFSERFTDLSELKNNIKEAVNSWDELDSLDDPQTGDIHFIKNNNAYAEYRWTEKTETDPDTNEDVSVDLLAWEEISIGFQHGYYNYGQEEEEEIKTSFSTVFGNSIPQVRQKGNIHFKKDSFANFSPRVIFNSGYNNIFQSLDWENYQDWYFFKGETGLIPLRWKNWARFWANRLPVTGSFQLPLNILYYAINNITQKFRTRHGEFIIEEMETEFKGNIIGPTEIKGYKVE